MPLHDEYRKWTRQIGWKQAKRGITRLEVSVLKLHDYPTYDLFDPHIGYVLHVHGTCFVDNGGASFTSP